MISDRLVVINRCQSTLCRHVLAYVPGVSVPIEVIETGSESCEHVFEPGMAVSLRRDVLILHGIWTVGRIAVESGMDARAHVLAESLGYAMGDHVPVTEVPLQLVDIPGRQLTWQGVCLASRVARVIAGKFAWSTHDATYAKWGTISDYLARWQHHVL